MPIGIVSESTALTKRYGQLKSYRVAPAILLAFLTVGIWSSCVNNTEQTPYQPVAMVDPAAFVPNPEFEGKLGGYIRSSSGSAEMKSPEIGENVNPENGVVKINFLGTMPASSDNGPQPLLLKIYSNQPSSDQVLFSTMPEITNRAPDTWTFSAAQQLPLAPGLYYFILEQTLNKDLVFAGKFTVGKTYLPKR